MEFFKTKETHRIKKTREFHTIKMCVPTAHVEYVEEALELLRTKHKVPNGASIRINAGWTTYVVAEWTVDL